MTRNHATAVTSRGQPSSAGMYRPSRYAGKTVTSDSRHHRCRPTSSNVTTRQRHRVTGSKYRAAGTQTRRAGGDPGKNRIFFCLPPGGSMSRDQAPARSQAKADDRARGEHPAGWQRPAARRRNTSDLRRYVL